MIMAMPTSITRPTVMRGRWEAGHRLKLLSQQDNLRRMRRQMGSRRGNLLYLPRISSISCCSLSDIVVPLAKARLDIAILQWLR